MPQYSFREAEDFIHRLPIEKKNDFVIEELLKQPYDIFRPIMDMLFSGQIVFEDLISIEGVNSAGAQKDSEKAESKRELTSWDISQESMRARCIEIITNANNSSIAIIPRDNSALLVDELGNPVPAFTGAGMSVLSSNSDTSTPNVIETMRSGTEIDAQKDAQDNFRAAIQPRVI